jgi:hypothetical protein
MIHFIERQATRLETTIFRPQSKAFRFESLLVRLFWEKYTFSVHTGLHKEYCCTNTINGNSVLMMLFHTPGQCGITKVIHVDTFASCKCGLRIPLENNLWASRFKGFFRPGLTPRILVVRDRSDENMRCHNWATHCKQILNK